MRGVPYEFHEGGVGAGGCDLMHINQLCEEVTRRIISETEAGAVPWRNPWKAQPGNHTGVMPQNSASGERFTASTSRCSGTPPQRRDTPPAWLTYKRAEALNAQVRKGERSITVVFTKRITVKDRDTEDEKAISMLKTFPVFNVSQVEGLPDTPVIADVPAEERHETLDAFIAATKADIRHGGDMACYLPSLDFINMPPRGAFKSPEHYYATGLHELAHWTGAKTRLDRDLTGRFRTRSYAAEELVAEMGAAFLCAHLNIAGELRHAGYIQNWLELLKEDNRAIFTAASRASQAADYLRSFSEPTEEEEPMAE